MSENASENMPPQVWDKIASDTVVLRGGPLDNRRRQKVGNAPRYEEDGLVYVRTDQIEGGEAVYEYKPRP